MASKRAQERPKRGSRGPQDGPKSAQERSKCGLRGPQDGIFEPPRGRWELRDPPCLAIRNKTAPRGLPDLPKEPQEGPNSAPREPQESPERHHGDPKRAQ